MGMEALLPLLLLVWRVGAHRLFGHEEVGQKGNWEHGKGFSKSLEHCFCFYFCLFVFLLQFLVVTKRRNIGAYLGCSG